ncbi:MAG: hypothetical protein JXN62_03885 [Bacteroidales bacterium]|nr:hypothetical protein [Bacteroidales bacterium]
MYNKTILHRILYSGIGLVIIVVLILSLVVIPSVLKDTSPQAAPERAIPGIVVVIIIHLLIVAALVRAILINKQGRRFDKGLLIALGVVLILLSLMVLDGASAYLDHTDPVMHRVAISMFFCTGFNFIAGVLVFFTLWYSRRLRPPSA